MVSRFVYLTGLWLIFHGLDTATTVIALERGLREANPLPAMVLNLEGIVGFLAWKWFWVAWIPLLCWALARRWRLWPVLQIGIIGAQIAVLNNVYWLLR